LIFPFLLIFVLSDAAGDIIGFLNEILVEHEDAGWVCSFAVFDFKRHGDWRLNPGRETESTVEPHIVSNNGKMEQSFLAFKSANPDWKPEMREAGAYLKNVGAFMTTGGRTNTRQPSSPGPSSAAALSPLGIAADYSDDSSERSDLEQNDLPVPLTREARRLYASIAPESRLQTPKPLASKRLQAEDEQLQAGAEVFDLLNQVRKERGSRKEGD